VFASLFQYVSVTENEDLQPKLDKAQIGDGNEEGDKEAAIGADDNILVQSQPLGTFAHKVPEQTPSFNISTSLQRIRF